MKIRVVSSKEEISNITDKEEMIHLSFRPSNTDIFTLIKKCPELKALHVPSSYIKTISRSARMFLEMQGIALVEGDVWGHRKDINEYSEVSESVYESMDRYREEGLSDKEIEEKMAMELNMGSDLIRFMIKNRK